MFRKKKGILAGILTLAALATISGGVTAFADSSASANVSVSTIIDPTVTLALNTNSIDFQHTNPLVPSYTQNLTATVQSNANYRLYCAANDDFKTTDATPKVFSIDHLGVKLDSDSDYKTMSKDSSNPIVLTQNQPATAGTTYPIDFQLKTDWLNALPGSYATSVQFTASQF